MHILDSVTESPISLLHSDAHLKQTYVSIRSLLTAQCTNASLATIILRLKKCAKLIKTPFFVTLLSFHLNQ